MQNNELKMNYLKPNCFEKTKEAWGIFYFFSSTNVETKNVCPIADNIESTNVKTKNKHLNKHEKKTKNK